MPKIDVHVHVAPQASETALAVLREQGIRIGLNASGGHPGTELARSEQIAQSSGGRLQPLCNIALNQVQLPDWTAYVTAVLERCKAQGGRGLKLSKYLGLGLRSARGELMAVDDPLLDPMFEEAGRLGLPVLIHSGDPRAFFEPPTPANERYEELSVHPNWSFYGLTRDGLPWPSWHELLDQLERRIARHPKTVFVGAHFGNAAEDPDRVAAMLERYPQYFIDTAARVPEFGRHDPKRMRAFFERYQDRILFGSDLGVGPRGLTLGSGGLEPGTVEGARTFFARHWAYFESNQRKMAHPTPIQGAWTVDGIGLPKPILEKLYWRNAAKVFGIDRLPDE
jgi:hypothetical protein